MSSPGTPMSVRADGLDLAYVERGEGVPVVFVHGSVNDFRSWRRQIDTFSERYRAVAYSRRYHWPNQPPAAGDVFSIAQHVADLADVIINLGLAPAHIVGSSYGAMTALTLAIEEPALLRSLVLGEPPLLPWLPGLAGGQALLDTFLSSAFHPAGEAFARGETREGVRTFIDGVIGAGAFDRMGPPAQASMLDNAEVERLETVTPSDQYFPALTPADVAPLQVPVLLLKGEKSPPMFGLITDELARVLPTAERITIPGASHGMHAQNPAAYNDAVFAFLARQDRRDDLAARGGASG
ncbi:MAG TPA: alpha/beta hydrolase [Thermomicrobiales bacterium]|nr:alpha/beta hydrolase [Thermomicrobiales bacterium]